MNHHQMTGENKSMLMKANEAVANGDHEGFLSYCTEDTEWNFVGEQILQGKEAVRQYMAKAYLEPPKFRVEHLIAEAEFVTAVGKISMKDETGEMVTYDYCDVWKFRDVKLHELKAFVVPVQT